MIGEFFGEFFDRLFALMFGPRCGICGSRDCQPDRLRRAIDAPKRPPVHGAEMCDAPSPSVFHAFEPSEGSVIYCKCGLSFDDPNHRDPLPPRASR